MDCTVRTTQRAALASGVSVLGSIVGVSAESPGAFVLGGALNTVVSLDSHILTCRRRRAVATNSELESEREFLPLEVGRRFMVPSTLLKLFMAAR